MTSTMTNWEDLECLLQGGSVPACVAHGLWTLAIAYVPSPAKLKFVVPERIPDPATPRDEAQIPNVWNYSNNKLCTADGDPRAAINPANCVLSSAPPGALIGKIGGSIAGKADGTRVFLIGTYCVFELDDKTPGGPLYLAMNADPLESQKQSGNIVVQIQKSM
jgi:hypothetical protein